MSPVSNSASKGKISEKNKKKTIKDLEIELSNFKEFVDKKVSELLSKINILEIKLKNNCNDDKTMKQSKFICKQCDQSFNSNKTLKSHRQKEHPIVISCKVCEDKFSENVKLELHMNIHKIDKQEKCDDCGKVFYFKWRLKKHKEMHTDKNVKKCHYFNNDKICPYEEIGCKFQHVESLECIFKKKCTFQLCQYRHSN